eukprot:GEMP01073881.1.p1 GENE.GEMP01073881.1~~GEMP01073881.1.p1  ORF type:complete len:335 (+),score=70.29 GEMP01073881.1:119-1123(+)
MSEELFVVKHRIADAQKRYEELAMENEMLADFLMRQSDRSPEADSGQAKAGARRTQQRPKTGTLSLEEKFKIASQQVDVLTKDIDRTRKTSEHNLDILKALMEETDVRTAEVKRDAYEFRRDIVVSAENPRTGKTVAEKVLKYLEDKLTQKDMLINKLLMKNQAFRVQIKKADAQLKSKQETGDDLQYIDFHQLQIENLQFVAKIEEANQELLQLKRTSGKTVKLLNKMKRKLTALSKESGVLAQDIKEKRAMLAKTESDIVKVVQEKEVARKDNKKFRAQTRTSPETPQVVDYVKQKAEEFELKQQRKSWTRKVELISLAENRLRQAKRQGQY